MATEPIFDSFIAKIKQVFEDEVAEHNKHIIADLIEARESISKYEALLNEKNNEIKSLRQELGKAATSAFSDILDGWQELDEAYYLKESTVHIECPICGDKKYIYLRSENGIDVKATCPICDNYYDKKMLEYVEVLPQCIPFYSEKVHVIFDGPNVYPAVKEFHASKFRNLNDCYKQYSDAEKEANTRTAENKGVGACSDEAHT